MPSVHAATIDHYLAPVRKHLADQSVSEVMINKWDEIYIERDGQLLRSRARFDDPEAYRAAVNNVLQFTGKRFSDDNPLVDGRLPDGSRVHVAKPPCARHGTVMTIRKFAKQMLDIDWLIHMGTLTQPAREYLQTVIVAERNLLVTGGTSSGKTSLLNALSAYIPRGERIVVIEDSSELQLQQEHVVALESRAADRFGRGGVDIRELFRSSLRLRPDRIIIGEVRGGEALDMIQAMTSGHGGSMGTLHANNAADALNRLETLALMSKVELPLHALRSQISSAIDVVVQLSRQIGGRRLVTQIAEVMPLSDAGSYRLRDIFSLIETDHEDEDQRMELRWSGQTSELAGRLRREKLAELSEATLPIFTAEASTTGESGSADVE
jgi:pilus assembly protein CpaF